MPVNKKLLALILSKYHYKLLFSFLICTVLPLIIMGSAFYGIAHKIAGDSILNSVILADDQLNIRINNRINQVKNVADSMRYDMYSLIRKMRNNTKDFSVLANVRDNISLLKSTFNLYHIDIFTDDKNIAASEGLYFHSLKELGKSGIDDITKIDSEWIYKRNYTLPYVLNNKRISQNVTACVRILNNQATGDTEYAYMVLLRGSEFSKMLTDTFESLKLKGYISDKDGTIIAHTDQKLTGLKLKDEDLSFILNQSKNIQENGNVYYHTVKLSNGWFQVTEIPKDYIYKRIYILLKTFILIMFISIPIILMIIFLISGNLTKRISKLSSAMENFKIGNKGADLQISLTTAKNPDYFDEIDKLGVTFLNMQSSINKNMHSILELTLSEEKLKYRLLQSQINPHFLYNILGTIKTCQSIGKIDVANHMISNLTQFYRMSLR